MRIPVTLKWLVPGLVTGAIAGLYIYDRAFVFDTVRGPDGGMLQNMRVLKNPNRVLAEHVALDGMGDMVVVAPSGLAQKPWRAGRLFVWDVPAGEIVRNYSTAFLNTINFAISPGGDHLIMPTLLYDAIPTSNYEKWRDPRGVRFAVLQPRTRSMAHVPPIIPAELDSWHSAARFPMFSADGQLVLMTDRSDETAYGVYEVGTWRRVAVGGTRVRDREKDIGFEWVEAISFARSRTLVEVYNHDVEVGPGSNRVVAIRQRRLMDFETIQEIPMAYDGEARAYAIDPVGPTVAIGGMGREFFTSGRETPTPDDRAIRVWHLGGEPREQALRNERGTHTDALIFTRDGRYLLSVDSTFVEDAVLQIWDLSTGEVVESYELPRAVSAGFVLNMAMSGNGRRLAMAYMDRTYVWDVIPRSE